MACHRPLHKNVTSSTKPEVRNIAAPPEKNRARAVSNMRIKFGEVWPCGFFELYEQNRGMGKQTYSSQYLARTPLEAQ